ncbi:hypothetical protein MKZ20_18175 [Psychrobacillus sp. FSL K6-2684]|uniref:hypothetical protein n=1 Tax=unclassified Psychrobacillus TaxID=2636677 RepID=UPI0012466C26|nr:hypothetical protein [Psychrobacillus sp. AK 1817]QEY21937.1 hypothetical protein D0S48_15370 [Psychrobacillus sp. AK 1817]
MSSMFVFLVAFLPIVLIIVVALILIQLFKKRKRSFNGSFKLKKYIIFTYIVILLMATLVFELIPSNHSNLLKKEEVQDLEAENKALEEALKNSETNSLTEKFLIEEWTQELSGTNLSIGYEGIDTYSTRFVVEWTDSSDQVVEGKVYRTNTLIFGIPMEEKIPLHMIYWSGNHLVSKEITGQKVEFNKFSNSLTILPDDSNEVFSYENVRGVTYIHLKVPKHIEIDDPLGLQIY